MTNESNQQARLEVAHAPRLERLLLIMNADVTEEDDAAWQAAPLVHRALSVARQTGCELEMLHVCHDETLTPRFFPDSVTLQRERRKLLDQEATRFADLAVRLSGEEGIRITHDTRWDTPRCDAILRKIEEVQPDLVMKQARGHGYFLGLMNNTEWNLIRRSPVPIWFVADGGYPLQRIVAAIGASPDEAEMINAADYEVFRWADMLADEFGADNHAVHAYQAPAGISSYAAHAPEFGGTAYPPVELARNQQRLREIARWHGRSIEAFAEYFHLDADKVQVSRGNPCEVISAAAKALNAGLIVAGARSMSRWQRLTKPVTAEPLLADAPCDVLFVGSDDEMRQDVPAARDPVVRGVPEYNLEQAVVDPGALFSDPQDVVDAETLSRLMRKRILEIWEQNLRAEMVAEEEGAPVRRTNADLLNAVVRARTALQKED